MCLKDSYRVWKYVGLATESGMCPVSRSQLPARGSGGLVRGPELGGSEALENLECQPEGMEGQPGHV